MAETDTREGWSGWRCLRVLVYLFLGLVVVDLVIASQRRLWRAYDPDEYRERIRVCRRGAHDLLVVGGSTVAQGIDARVLAGVPWYGQRLDGVHALGLGGATSSEIWHAVKHGVKTPPRLLVYGITASDLNDGRQEPHGPRTLMDWSDLAAWVQTRPRSREWCVRHFLTARLERCWQLYRHPNGIRLWAADQAERLWPGAFRESAAEARKWLAISAALQQEHGFAPRPDIKRRRFDRLKAAGSLGPPFSFLDNYALGEHLGCLHQLLDWASRNRVEVLLVDMPVTPELERRHAREFQRYREVLSSLEQHGIRVLRPSRAEVGLDDSHFADLVHLNVRGAARMSAWLRAELEEEAP
jgi:hypothetical protein